MRTATLDTRASESSPLTDGAYPLVSVVLLSYNRPGLLNKALASLCSQSYRNFEVTVVDNPSEASTEVARVVSQYPGVKLIQTDRNLGYAGGMNLGLASVSGDYVYLTEDDVVLDADCISTLFEHASLHPSGGLFAPIIYSEANRTINCAGGEVALGGTYRKKLYGEGAHDTGQFAHPFNVSYIDGAAIFARADFLKRLQGFRADFFMYVESVELCMRVLSLGQPLVIVPQARVYHFEPPDNFVSPEIAFHKFKNFLALYLLHAPLRVLPEFICRYAVWNTLRAIFTSSGDARARLRALRWVLGRSLVLLKERRRDLVQQTAPEVAARLRSGGPSLNSHGPEAVDS